MAEMRVFVRRLAGLAVVAASGEAIGHVRDVVVTLRFGHEPPQVLGLVVDMPARRSIFVPMGRVSSVEPRCVTLFTASLNVRPFEQRGFETLLIRQIIDAKARVSVATTGAAAVVADVEVEQARSRDWFAQRVAVRPHGSRLGHRAGVDIVLWVDVRGLSADVFKTATRRGARDHLVLLEGLKAPDMAAAVHHLSPSDRNDVAAVLGDERLADLIEELPVEDQVGLITGLPQSRTVGVLERMNPDDAADLLAELPEGARGRLVELMEPSRADPVARLMRYPPDVAGGLMTTAPVILAPNATVAEALARIRDAELTPALASTVFVCRPPQSTPTGQYLGCVDAGRLLRDPPFTLVSEAVDRDLPRIRDDASLGEITRHLATYNLVLAPVVDHDEHLLGAVAVDDVLDNLLPRNWRTHGLDGRYRPEQPTGDRHVSVGSRMNGEVDE